MWAIAMEASKDGSNGSHGASLKSLCGYATANQHSAVSYGNVVRGMIEGEFIKNKHSVPFLEVYRFPLFPLVGDMSVVLMVASVAFFKRSVGGPSRAVVFGIAL